MCYRIPSFWLTIVCLEKPVLQTALSALNNLRGDPIDSAGKHSGVYVVFS